MESEGLEEGEIFEASPETSDNNADNNDAGFWVKMKREPNKSKENFNYYRKSYHYSATESYSSTRKRNQQRRVSSDRRQDISPTVHPLDPLGDYDPRLHSAKSDWGDTDERSPSYRRLIKSYLNDRTKVDNIIKTDKNHDEVDQNVVDENSPDHEKDPEQEEELNELQLRLEALQSTIEKSREKSVENNSSTNQIEILNGKISTGTRRKLDSDEKMQNSKPERKKSRTRRRKTYFRDASSVPKEVRERRKNAVKEWTRLQREKILQMSDHNEQCKQFVNMNAVSRKHSENVSTSRSSYRRTSMSDYSNVFDLSSSFASTNEDYTLKNMEIDSDPDSPKIYSQGYNDNHFSFPSVWNGLVPRRRPPLLPEPMVSMQCFAQQTNNTLNSLQGGVTLNSLQCNNVVVQPIKPDCRDDEEFVILKCNSSDDSIEMTSETRPESSKPVDVITIEEEDVDNDDETMALREILLKSMQQKKEKPERNEPLKTPPPYESTPTKVSMAPTLKSSQNGVLITVGGNGRRNVEVGRYNYASNSFNSNAPSTSPTKWSASPFTKLDAQRLIVSTSSSPNTQRVVLTGQHKGNVANSTNQRSTRNQNRSIRNFPFVDHKPVLIPLDDESDDENEIAGDDPNTSSAKDFYEEDALDECLRNARKKADVAKKRRQNALMVEMLEDRLKQCRNDLLKHKDSLSEDSTRLRTLESTASKRKTDLRLAEMKLQKLKEELRNVEHECASHRVFILRLNKEIQNVQSRVDRSMEMQIVYEKQWKEIQELVARHRTIVERRSVKRKNNNVSSTDQIASYKRRRTMSSTTKAAAVCLKRAKRKSSDAAKRNQKLIENELDSVLSSDFNSNNLFKSSSDQISLETKDSLGANKDLLNDASEENGDVSRTSQERSPLLCFRSYRLTKNFSTISKLPLSSLTYCNKIQPNVQFCPYALNGKCFDSNCKWQHECDFKLSEVEAIADLLAFCPSLINGCTDGDSIIKCAEELYSNLKEKMSFEEILEQCALQIRQERNDNCVDCEQRCWKPTQIVSPDGNFDVFTTFKRNPSFPSSEISDASSLTNELFDSSSIRYFSPNYQLETENSPNDVHLWIQWAITTLNDFSADFNQRNVRALKILCDALDKNRNDTRLWLNYLHMYKFQSDSDENLHKLNLKALDFAQSFELYWNLWDVCRTIEENFECFEKSLSFFDNNFACNDVSGHIFRSVLRMVWYLVKNNKISDAKIVLKKFLNKTFPGVDKMYFKHKSLIWSTYIYLEHVGRLPISIEYYIYNDINSSAEIFEGDFEIPWDAKNLNENQIAVILSHFADAFVSCRDAGSVEKRSENVEICWILYKNRINLECKLGRFVEAVKFCDSALDACDKHFDDLLIVSRQCRLHADCRR